TSVGRVPVSKPSGPLVPVGWRGSGPGAAPGPPSIRVGPATAPSTLYRIRPWRPARQRRSPPIEQTVTLGGSPGGRTAAPTDRPLRGGIYPAPSTHPAAGAAAAFARCRSFEFTRTRQSFSTAPPRSSPPPPHRHPPPPRGPPRAAAPRPPPRPPPPPAPPPPTRRASP